MRQTVALKSKLASIVGESNLTNDPVHLEQYASDQSFVPRSRPHLVVFPQTTEQVQEIVVFANQVGLPVVPRSSPVGLHGAGIPTEGGLVMDLSRMDRILAVDQKNWQATIEPGVSFVALQEKLRPLGLRAAGCLLEPPSASVISSYLERVPVVTAADFTYGAEHIISYTVVSPTGENFTVGHPPLANTAASAPDGPGLNFYRIFQGAQGTLGVVTWMVIRVLPLPQAHKVLFLPAEDVLQCLKIMRTVQKYELGLECVALNAFNLAAMMVGLNDDQQLALQNGTYLSNRGAPAWDTKVVEEYLRLRKDLPAWTVVLRLCGTGPLPDEKIAYQEQDLQDKAVEMGASPVSSLREAGDLAALFAQEFDQPCRLQQRFGYRGSCHPILFHTRPDKLEKLHNIVEQQVAQFRYARDDVGITLLPHERGRSFFCSYDFHCCLDNERESQRVSQLMDHLSRVLIDAGAFFDRPYGHWAELVYQRAGSYTEYLRRLKGVLDPQHIMNPGKLCF